MVSMLEDDNIFIEEINSKLLIEALFSRNDVSNTSVRSPKETALSMQT